uniref:Uncharacterized protein n=1 Tax=Pithovirus LCPAC304 TaxID=2506594 RepID=A0A481ZAN6_9VIRU|nr:MAG: hypothetical protein LCPAC304_00370 [Pithovirus LCPAC304]
MELLEPEPPLLAMRHNQELLRIILLNMNYDEIIAFCNTHPEFKDLCDDPDSIVGQTLREKERSAIARVHLYDLTSFRVEIVCSDIISNTFGLIVPYDDMDTLKGPAPASVYFVDEGITVYITTENMVHVTSGHMAITMHHDLFRKILEVVEDGKKGVTEIYRNGDTRYIG